MNVRECDEGGAHGVRENPWGILTDLTLIAQELVPAKLAGDS